jgi:hypothetical protein
VRELRPPGFVRGALSNECPYRDRLQRVDVIFSMHYERAPLLEALGEETGGGFAPHPQDLTL